MAPPLEKSQGSVTLWKRSVTVLAATRFLLLFLSNAPRAIRTLSVACGPRSHVCRYKRYRSL